MGAWDRSIKVLDFTLYLMCSLHQCTIGKVSLHEKYPLTFTFHLWSSCSVLFFNPLKYLITGARDGSIKVWDPAWHLKLVFVGHRGPVMALAIYPYGPYIMSGSEDTTIRVWSLETCDEVDLWVYFGSKTGKCRALCIKTWAYHKASSRGAYGHDPFWRASTWFHNNRYYNGTIYIIDNVIVLSDLVESSRHSSKTLQTGSCPYAPLDEVLR